VTSTLIYGKSEAILVDCQFRISAAKRLADQILNAWEAGETGRRIADCRRAADHDSACERSIVTSGFALSLEAERQPQIWNRVTNGEERPIATMSGTLFALFEIGG
jgi:hypothetical protein